MGGGPAGHVQDLFAEDVLGTTAGHRPRQAKAYADFRAERAALQEKRWPRCGPSRTRSTRAPNPTPETVADAGPDVVAAFREWLARQPSTHQP